MRKMVFGKQLSRGRKAREALLVSLIKALVDSGKITTTKAKAKFMQGQVDKLIRNSQDSSIASRRRVYSFLRNDRKTTDILFDTIAPLFADRKSGFTRIILLPKRKGDNAEMARIELVKEKAVIATTEKEPKAETQKKAAKKDKPAAKKTKKESEVKEVQKDQKKKIK